MIRRTNFIVVPKSYRVIINGTSKIGRAQHSNLCYKLNLEFININTISSDNKKRHIFKSVAKELLSRLKSSISKRVFRKSKPHLVTTISS
jgi:glyceraldehyde-3-phosphate dehydrogenase/erythrose-4-phosphate dehydrogenase